MATRKGDGDSCLQQEVLENEYPPLVLANEGALLPKVLERQQRRKKKLQKCPWTDPSSPLIGKRQTMKESKVRVWTSAMDASIGVNLRVTAHSNQGGRKYMEDMFCVAYQPTSDEKDLLYAYFGIFDGHGGREAALYAKTHLMDHIVSQKNFWSDNDDDVLKSIRDGFVSVHHAMWRELDKWPKTQSGLPSTSGTTASVAFVRRGKLYIGHVGDSGIILGYQDPNSNFWKARPLTNDHKPESPVEHARIQECGGKVVSKSGVPRVVWNRPRLGHKGPVRRSTLIDEIPFLAVARSLGDLWSYNSEQNEFVVSPVPDTSVIEIDVNTHRCLILGSDGLWNMLTPQDAVNSVYFAEKNNERQHQIAANEGNGLGPKNWINPSKRLVDRALDRWYGNNLRADNTSVVTVVIDPPGPPKKPPSPRQSTASTAAHERTSSSPKQSPLHPASHMLSSSARYQRTVATSRVTKDTRTSPRSVAQTPVATPDVAPTSRPKSDRVASASQSKSVPATNVKSGASRKQDKTAGRKKKKQPMVSSKTSRVLAKTSFSEGTDNNQETDAGYFSPNANQEPFDNQEEGDLNDTICDDEIGDDVQIHEISSSCETNKAEGAAATPSAAVGSKTGKKKMQRANKRLPKSSGAVGASTPQASSRKRLARNTENAPDETASQRKIMKVSNETVPPKRPSVAKKGMSAGQKKERIPVGRRNRTSIVKKTTTTSGSNELSGSAPVGQNVAEAKENGRKIQRSASTSLPSSSRTTRGNALKETSALETSAFGTVEVQAATVSPKKSTDGSRSQLSHQNGGNKVTLSSTSKKPLRGATQPDVIESQDPSPPSTSNRTRSRSVGPPALAQKNPLTNLGKREITPVSPNVNNRVRCNSFSDNSFSPSNRGVLKSLKRLKGKASSPSRRAVNVKQSQDKKAGSGAEEMGSPAGNLRSSSTPAVRVTRSMKK